MLLHERLDSLRYEEIDNMWKFFYIVLKKSHSSSQENYNHSKHNVNVCIQFDKMSLQLETSYHPVSQNSTVLRAFIFKWQGHREVVHDYVLLLVAARFSFFHSQTELNSSFEYVYSSGTVQNGVR